MSAPKWTSGKWRVGGGASRVFGPNRDDGRLPELVCVLTSGIPTQRQRANVRLIASAPDLYAACHALIYGDDLQVAIDLARAALAKARGEG